ncbi:kinetochore complex Sim4 subunit Fta1-domain-containing protein [Achaetomium macrosporum]|uniref:Kinetochore complex Sim4 subunit Fta1-domain-containing protein n=1 Tax=Achaetomium macrosporum TaxID=79813 RepID=A0AAN7CAG6_9PEZI|nr:kinetochore complex Sim4 subunit Fta1-domain-containing protein [Achaetomium macrosporum]
MPPKRRRPRPASPSPQPAPDRDDHDQSPSLAEEQEPGEEEDVPFYNITFTAHRVSPLYLGTGNGPLTAIRLALLAQRLRDRLVGDVVRGVEVGGGPSGGPEDGGAMMMMGGRAGALEGVEMRWVDVAGGVLGFSANREGEVVEGLQGKKALHIALRYEMAVCTALLLPRLLAEEKTTGERGGGFGTRLFAVGTGAGTVDEMDWERDVDPDRFLELPLLLLRMPAPLQAIVGEFLATAFDCRITPMRLGTRTLVRSWEAWIRSAGLPDRGSLAKDMVLTLGFYLPPQDRSSLAQAGPSDEDATKAEQPLGLKSIDVIIPAGELQKFVAAGKRLNTSQHGKTQASPWGWENDVKKRRILAGRLYEEGWAWRTDDEGSPEQQPFTEALACYLKEHLALNLFHPGVRVAKIACSGFAISDTRVKVFTPADSGDGLGPRGAVVELIGRLAEKAQVSTAGS